MRFFESFLNLAFLVGVEWFSRDNGDSFFLSQDLVVWAVSFDNFWQKINSLVVNQNSYEKRDYIIRILRLNILHAVNLVKLFYSICYAPKKFHKKFIWLQSYFACFIWLSYSFYQGISFFPNTEILYYSPNRILTDEFLSNIVKVSLLVKIIKDRLLFVSLQSSIGNKEFEGIRLWGK